MEYEPVKIEQEILKYWADNKIYEGLKENNKRNKIFYYLDGPPYTTGRIHVGHAWGKSLRDCFCRYKRMTGANVIDPPGFDMHGLPIETKVEEKLGLKGKQDIVAMGIDKFNDECKKFALENMHPMINDFKRIGIWLDWENPYMSIKSSYIEGAWWALKKAYQNNLLYKGQKVMTWCPRCATALAKHELEYKNVKDNSIFVKLKVKGQDNTFLIVWTTTPWTIPFNLAVMAGPDIDYIKAKVDNETWILSEALSTSVIGAVAGKEFSVLDKFKGEKLLGLEYEHPLTKDDRKRKVILSERYVDTSAGTGLVHCAPGCGPEDYEVAAEYKIGPYNTLDENGVFQEIYVGKKAKTDDSFFIDEIEKSGALIATTKCEHEYAHCWRCESPVVFRLTSQWFLAVEQFKQKMIRENEKIEWMPDWAGQRWFKSWLSDLKDWCISRQRFWGIPLPIWACECGHITMVGSKEELEQVSGKKFDDLHRPHVDVSIKCKCGKTVNRVPDILDVWLDSGAAPWAALNYPSDKMYEKIQAADFILEGKDQIRGWFNSLMCLSMVSWGKPSYKSVYMHGMINDSQGRKMSKHLGNVISPYEVIDKYGADTMRYYMIGGTSPGTDLVYNFKDMEAKSANLRVLWNTHKFLIDLAREVKDNPEEVSQDIINEGKGKEEEWILSKANSAIQKVTTLYEEHKLNEVPAVIEDLYLELSRTYIQLVRDKANTGDPAQKIAVLYTIYTVLMQSVKMLSTVAPFMCERIYLNIKEQFNLEKPSITHYDWPIAGAINSELENNMVIAQNVITAVNSVRDKMQLGLRWPVAKILVVAQDKAVRESIVAMSDLIKLQTNVKTLEVSEQADFVKESVKANTATIGKTFGEKAPKLIFALAKESSKGILDHIRKENKFMMKSDGVEYEIKLEHLTVSQEMPVEWQGDKFAHGYVYVNKERTPELDAEGFSREITRSVQQLRKDAGLQKYDLIKLHIQAGPKLAKMLEPHRNRIASVCGADKFTLNTSPAQLQHNKTVKIKDESAIISFDILE